ncbi:beta-hexosaminidase [Parastagonospora nodorum]|uniref:Beta-hexosaminidase n=1 Tax=Phaeosphaeria nodorum (strain SN15 / ATCC MYA-4574 / FGSC 10173) TaxID=321614 RepID=A0A7U2HSF8_PHANO|nr:beta-hexosaminidase [Parastagonospora nodorum]QRC90165.1 beta-hexosaminidase isoform A [Parastagonospora nodorum SN15]KAH3938022.1 beta-hexosaminidase [Parastagonospora nodorum]KAH3940932.1 beta-hexosaminidase [Parastagonospora nodorum]KAH3956298.1 beta-hexosaminidase [Parastagonospora nodorum]
MNLIILLPLFLSSASALWPKPVSYTHGNTVLFIEKSVSFLWYGSGTRNEHLKLRKRYTEVSLDSRSSNGSQAVSGDEIIDYAIKSAYSTIFTQNFVPWKYHPRGWEEPSPGKTVSEVKINLLKNDPENVSRPLAGEVDESYTLTLTEDGKATVSANSSIGIAHGLNSFTQLFYAHSDGTHVYTPLAPVSISDAPKFQHRGINLDVSRNYFSVADIKRQIDALAYNKMNRFHLHITDSQSWPLVIPSLPTLAAKGAYRPDLVYTPQDFADIQRHAAIQGVEMITEIDMPGHTASIWHAFPDLISAYNKQPDWSTWAAEPPSGTLKLNSPAVYDFLNTLLADLLPRVAPYSSYFHTGGDEVNKNAYTLDETVGSNDTAILQPLMQKFVDRNHDQVRAAGLTPLVWEEMLLEWNVTLGSDVIVQSWQSDQAVKDIVDKGHKVLVGNYNYWYLDCGKGQFLDFAPSSAAGFWPYNDYCAPFHNWRLIYSYDPLAGIPADKQHLVLGGEAHMWAEMTDPVNVDRMVWPRAAAVGEILWSGAKDEMGQNRSQIDASPRLGEMRERLVARGVGAEPVQMPYCTMNGTQCQLGYTG